MVHGSWLKNHGSCLKARGSRLVVWPRKLWRWAMSHEFSGMSHEPWITDLVMNHLFPKLIIFHFSISPFLGFFISSFRSFKDSKFPNSKSSKFQICKLHNLKHKFNEISNVNNPNFKHSQVFKHTISICFRASRFRYFQKRYRIQWCCIFLYLLKYLHIK